MAWISSRDEIALLKRISRWENWVVGCTAYPVEYVGVGNSTRWGGSSWPVSAGILSHNASPGPCFTRIGGAAWPLSSTLTKTAQRAYASRPIYFSCLQCLLKRPQAPPTGCPATQGSWHKASRRPNVTKVVDGVTCNGTSTPKTMAIGGVTYTQAQLLLLMPSGSLHTSGLRQWLSQFIAGVLNLAAGAQDKLASIRPFQRLTDLTGQPAFYDRNQPESELLRQPRD
jgi:hypothetical protein